MTKATRKKLYLLGAVVVMTVGVAALYQLRQVRTDQALLEDREQGMAAYERQQYGEAIPHLSRYVARHQDEPGVLLAFADARRLVPADDGSRSHLQLALRVTQIALALDPRSLRGRVMLMELANDLGQVTEADEAAAKVLEQDPTNLKAYTVRLTAARLTGRNEERILLATAAAEAFPRSYDVQFTALVHLIDSGMVPAALESFVQERRAALGESIASELLAAILADHQSRAESAAQAALLRAKVAEHLEAAISMTPEEPAEAETLIRLLDGDPPVAAGLTPDELLARYLDDPSLEPGLMAFAAERAWQRGNPDTTSQLVERYPDLTTLEDNALGWLALGLPDQTQLLDELSRRSTDTARAWVDLVQAVTLIRSGRFIDARGRIAPLLTSRSSGHDEASFANLAAYLDAICLGALGETSLADGRLESLRDNPVWIRARVLLRDQALQRGDYLEAFDLLLKDRLPETGYLLLDTAVALDEAGHRWAPDEIPGRVRADRALLEFPDDPALLSFHARAELAAGNTTRALEVADQLAGMTPEGPNPLVVRFADKLARLDPARARALREAFGTEPTDPVDRLTGQLSDGEITVDELRSRIEDVVDPADADQRLRASLLLAASLDEAGHEDAAAEFERFVAEYPSNAKVQLAALASSSLWQDPEAVQAIIGRLRGLTGEDGLSWRVFQCKLNLMQDGSEATAAQVIHDLSPVLSVAPRDALALQLMATAMTRVGDDRAVSYATRAADAVPADLGVALDAVDALMRAGRGEEAAARLAGLSALPADSIPLRTRRAGAFRRFGMHRQALDDWARLADTEDPPTRARAAAMLAALGQTEHAEAVVAELLALPRTSTETVTLTADALAALDRKDEALTLLRDAPALDEGRERPAVIAAFLARHARGHDDLEQLERFVRATDSADAWGASIRRYMGEGLLDDARRVLSDALNQVEDPAPLAVFQRALDPDTVLDPLAFLAFAQAGLAAQDADWTVELAAQLEPVINGDTTLQSFTAYLRRFVDDRPSVLMGWKLLAGAQATLGDTGGARTTAQAMLEALPADPRAAKSAADMFRQLGMVDEGLLAARQFQARLPGPSLESGRYIALFALAAGRPLEAWEAIAPWRPELHLPIDIDLFTLAALATGHTDAAREVFWAQAEDEARTHDGIGMASRIDDVVERKAWLATAGSRLSPTDEWGRFLLADGWYELAITAGDSEALQQALELTAADAVDPQIRARLSLRQAVCLEQLGRKAEAAESYRTVLRLMPDNPDACNNLAYLLLETGGDAEEALAHARHAVDVQRALDGQPEVLVSYLDTLGTALLAAGDPGEAVGAFEEALKTDPTFDYAVVGLAEALTALGRTAEARDILGRLDPSPSPALADRLARVREATK